MFQNNTLKYREPEKGARFSVLLAGDICPGDHGAKMVESGRAGEVLSAVSDFIRSADLRIVQWETPIADEEKPIPKSGPNLNSRAETIEIVRAVGFQVALLANNHTGDHEAAAVLETIEKLHARGLKTVGAGKNLREALLPLDLCAGGKKIKVLNFAENEFGIAEENKPGVAPQSPISNLTAVRKAAKEADFVIVALHGGHEHNPFPSPRIQEFCRALAEAGASLVFNCHTHCPEGIEFHNGTPIIYSPGNFFFPKYDGELWSTGYLTKCFFDSRGVYAVELLPYRFDKERVTPLTDAETGLFFRYMERLCEPLSDPTRMQRFFEAWSSKRGRDYLVNVLTGIPADWVEKLDSPAVVQQMLHLKNLYHCESHNDMTKCYLRLIEEYRTEDAAKLYPEIEAFQTPEWMADKK